MIINEKKLKKVYQAWIFFLESIVASGVDVKIVIFPRAPGRCCKPTGQSPDKVTCIYLYLYS